MVIGEEVRLSPQPSKLREKKKDTFKYDIIEFLIIRERDDVWEAIKVRASVFI